MKEFLNLVCITNKKKKEPLAKPEIFGPESFSGAVLNTLIRAAGKWRELSPGVEGRINCGGIEMRTHDGRQARPFLLR